MLPELFAWIRRSFVRLQTPRRITSSAARTAYALAVTIDLAQFLLGSFGWIGADEVLDAAAMFLISRVLGFHPLLLPTFVLELVPFSDMLPSWTACVALVVRARRRQGLVSDEAPDSPPVVEVKAKRVE